MNATRTATPLIAIAGNPNVGKTSVFNRLTGQDLKVSNYPGVTVERHEGRTRLTGAGTVSVLDIPGTYSLSGRSAEEQIAIQAIAGIGGQPSPDLIVVTADATQLSRNLYLVLQILEFGVPTVVALTMADVLERRGQHVEVGALERVLGIPVVPVIGHKGTGIAELRTAIDAVLSDPAKGRPGWRWQPEHPMLLEDIDQVGASIPSDWAGNDQKRRWALGLWALLSLDEEDELLDVPASLRAAVDARRSLAEEQGREIEAEVIRGRYEWIDRHAAGAVVSNAPEKMSRTERLDALLLHPVLGFGLFLLAMGVLFQSLFSWADPAIGAVEIFFGTIAGLIESTMPASLLRDFLIDGVIAGVGSVVVFLPQILLLFFLIGLMEDTGYMARVAFLMDRVMRRIGLHGRAFVPMLSGFACAVPAIMATRTMERRRDRMVTMMAIPLMTCSARLPVYTLLIAALFPPTKVIGFVPVQGLLMVAMYVFSTLIALLAAGVLGRFVFKGVHVPLILELPPYRVPHWSSVFRLMWNRGSVFLTEAGRVILVCTMILWVLLTFPRDPRLDTDYDALRTAAVAEAGLSVDPLQEDFDFSSLEASHPDLAAALAELDAQEGNDVFLRSYGARLGQVIEPVIEPLGFDWKIGIGLIGAFAAREVFISTLGVVYGIGEDVDEESSTLREKIRAETHRDGRPVYTPLVALSLMVFIALSCQCMSTLAAVYRETRGLRWPAFLFAYMTALAWIASLVVFQGGRALGLA
jgi:ferrous iron transport protein B